MTDIYVVEDHELADFKCDQTIIIKEKYLPFIFRGNYIEDAPPPKPQPIEWYPFANSYYSYTEDVDALERVNHLVASNPSFESITTINQDPEYEVEGDSYSESGAQLNYLQSQPACFFIIGKPGIGEERLGKLLAEYWKCVYIDPEILIRDEINMGTRAGQCIEFNLRCGRAIGVDVILRLLEKRVKTQSSKHRGFVISGFPLIHNDLYEDDPVSSESAVFSVQEIFEDIFEAVLSNLPPQVIANVSQASKFRQEEHGEGGEPENKKKLLQEEEAPPPMEPAGAEPVSTVPVDVGSAHADICMPGEIGVNYEEQLSFVFAQFDYQFLLIYVMCPNADVISKRANYRYNILSEEVLDLQEYDLNKHMFTIFSKDTGAVLEMPLEFFEKEQVREGFERDYSDKRHLVQLPRDFPINVVSQLERYHYAALSVIERHVLLHDPQYFMKVDGRCTPLRIFNILKLRLRVLPLQKVLIPEKLITVSEEDVGEDAEQRMDLNEDTTPEECFAEFRKRKIAGPLYKWTWSNWKTNCPVSMKEGDYKVGDPRFAVTFMNKIFFLRDEDAYIKFSRNPRPFLLPPYPKLSCKIFVIGPPLSGRTALSKCLAYFLNGSVICPKEAREEFLEQKRAEVKERIADAAMNEAITLLTKQKEDDWNKYEEERQKNVKEWTDNSLELLNEYVEISEMALPKQSVDIDDISSFPLKLAVKRYSVDDRDPEIVKRTRSELNMMLLDQNISCVDDLEECKQLLIDNDKLSIYLPEGLKYKEYESEPVSVFDDFVKDYVDNALEQGDYHKIQLTKDDLFEMFSTKIREVEDKNEEKGDTRGGWIVDGFPYDEELLDMMYPEFMADDVFLLTDDPEHTFLLQRFETNGSTKFDDFRNFFLSLGKTAAAWRAPSYHLIKPTESKSDAVKTMEDILESTNLSEARRSESVDNYKEELLNFESNNSGIHDYFGSKSVRIASINVSNKTIEALLQEVIENVEDRYQHRASAFSSEDRAEEAAAIGEPVPQEDEIGAEEMEEDNLDGELFMENRRYGDTYHYCPVTFHDNWVLWKGKEEHAVKFENKLYLCSSEKAMENFLQHPRNYLLQSKPPALFPPPRVCVVGPKSSGKTTVAKALSENFGLSYANYADLLKSCADIENTFDINNLRGEEEGTENDFLYDYIMQDRSLPDDLLNKVLGYCWYEEPLRSCGFVLDGFPFRPSDIDHMERSLFIPDVILELSLPENTLKDRNIQIMLSDWRIRMEAEQQARDAYNREVMDEWEKRRAIRFTELMEIRRENRYEEKLLEKSGKDEKQVERPYLEDLKETDEETDRTTVAKSEVTYDSVAEQNDVDEVNKILAEEMPEPVFEDNFETYEEATERFEAEFEESNAGEIDFLKVIRDYCDAEEIPWTRINAEFNRERVAAQAFRICSVFKSRNSSLFERCYDVSTEVAEKLLSNGYYFLSRFGRTCPVQHLEDKIPIQLFLPLEQKFQMFSMIYRQYIYFLAGKQHRDKFKKDPLKYVNQPDFNFPLIPFKVAITGPPKCGKTALSNRFLTEYGLKVITRGSAIRYVLEYLPHSQLAQQMESVLRKGWELTDDMVARSVEAASFDPKCVTQGMSFDGFPNTPGEVRHLAQLGLIPHLVLELQASPEQILHCLSTDTKKRAMRLYSPHIILYRYEEWMKIHRVFTHWFDREYQVTSKVPVAKSKWGVWTGANEFVVAVFSEIKHYYKHCRKDWPLRLANMQVTPLEYVERRSAYKSYCPCCLHHSKSLVTGGDPPDRTGLIQYRKKFYWLCENHIEEFLKYPELYLPPYNKNALPQNLPAALSLSEMPDNCYENGICIVCYKTHLPERKLVRGDLKYAVSYMNKVYIFDSAECLKTFMRTPLNYFTVAVRALDVDYPTLEYRELPTLGFLEQHVAKQLVKAVTRTAIDRPIIPGLTSEASAAIAIGLFLKLNNPNTPKSYAVLYKDAYKLFVKRTGNLKLYLKRMKETLNPHIHYEEPIPEFSMPEPPTPPHISTVVSTDSQISMIGIVDEILDRICYPE